MSTQPPPLAGTGFAVHTDTGNGDVSTERFETAEARLDRLRERAQAYFPGSALPKPRGDHHEDVYLAQLLGFFLMLSDGSVTLSEVTDTEECTEPE